MPLDKLDLDNCLKCTICNGACPVYAANAGYPGPKHLGPELERLRSEGLATATVWLEYCLGCHRCDLACPHQVGVSEMIARAKGKHRKNLVRGLRDWWFARPGLLGRLTTIVPAVSNFFLRLALVRFVMARVMQIAPVRGFPAYTRPNLRTPRIGRSENKRRVVLFPGCFIQYNRPDLGRTIMALLEWNGLNTEVAATGCCGVPASANGDRQLARALAEENVRTLAVHIDAGARVVTGCSSCGHMLKTGFGGLLEDDAELADAARRVGDQTFDVAELLMAEADAGLLNTNFKTSKLHIAYHAPCHLKSQGIGSPWFHLLRQVPGVTVEDLDAGCCGMSGTYGFKREKYEVSMAIGQELFGRIDAAQPEMVATECATCQMQIEHGTTYKAIHPAEILLKAYEGQPN